MGGSNKMKSHVSKNKFIDWFRSSDTYKNNFSYEGLNALFDWLEEYENDTGREVEFDPIAISCEYSEYENLKEFQNDCGDEYETLEDIENDTLLIRIEGEEGFIIQQF
jgi:hypothetical protein